MCTLVDTNTFNSTNDIWKAISNETWDTSIINANSSMKLYVDAENSLVRASIITNITELNGSVKVWVYNYTLPLTSEVIGWINNNLTNLNNATIVRNYMGLYGNTNFTANLYSLDWANKTFLDTNYYNKTQINNFETSIRTSINNNLTNIQNDTIIRSYNINWITQNQQYNTSVDIAQVKVNNATLWRDRKSVV